MAAKPTPAARTQDHVWDGNGVCQTHGRHCSMAPTEPPAPEPLMWHQVEPRRRYRAATGTKNYELIYQGRGAVGPDLEVGWYLEGGFDGKGSEFMGKRLQDAADAATRRILDACKD